MAGAPQWGQDSFSYSFIIKFLYSALNSSVIIRGLSLHTGSDPLYSGDHIFPLQIPDSDSIFFEDITLGIFIAQCMQNDPVAFIGAYEQLDSFFP